MNRTRNKRYEVLNIYPINRNAYEPKYLVVGLSERRATNAKQLKAKARGCTATGSAVARKGSHASTPTAEKNVPMYRFMRTTMLAITIADETKYSTLTDSG